jgi:hypothetical protein
MDGWMDGLASFLFERRKRGAGMRKQCGSERASKQKKGKKSAKGEQGL